MKGKDETLASLLREFDYELPEHLIATRPALKRDEARLLVYDQATQQISHHLVKDLPQVLPAQSALFCNNTQVISCRVMGQKETGAKIEIFFLADQLDESGHVTCMLKSSGKKRLGEKLLLPHGASVTIIDKRDDGSFVIAPMMSSSLQDYLFEHGSVPIPPYIRRGVSDDQDKRDYQTTFAKEKGSVAAPTASLHFTPELLEALKRQGHERHELTLHVGLGTFKPLESVNIKNKKLHIERFKMQAQTATALERAKYRVAVGTTSLRALESYQRFQAQVDQWCETDLFLMPGDDIRCVDGLMTNFHLPQSSLLMLVSAFIGIEATKKIYSVAVEQKYRFFSYGDAMLLLRPRGKA